MSVSLTEEQKMLIHLLKEYGCSKLQVLSMVAELELPEDMLEMGEFMESHLDATPAQLYEVCLQISSRRKQEEEQESEQ